MNDLERALNDIASIRNQIADVQLFHGFGPIVIAATGGLALGCGFLQTTILGVQSDTADVLTPWIVLACVSAILIGAEMWGLSRREHGAQAQTFLWSIVQKFLPAIMAGAVFGWVILTSAPDLYWLLPGVWQVMISLGVFAAVPMLPRRVILVAGWYFLAGTTVCLWASQSREISPWSMGIPFGFGQLMMAALLYWAPEKEMGVRNV